MSKMYNRIKNDSHAFLKSMLWEFKFIFRDVAVLFSFIIVSLGVSLIYTYLYSEEILTELPLAVVDLDNSTNSRQLLRMIDNSEETKIQGYYTSLNEAKIALEKNRVRGVVTIPVDFSRDLQRGEQPVVSVYTDASYMLYHKQILTAVKTSIGFMNAGVQLKKVSAKGNLPTQAMNEIMPVKATNVSLYNPSSGYATFLIPAVLIIIFQTTILTAIGILGGSINEANKMRHLYPNANHFLGTLPIIMGKATTYLVLSVGILTFMVGFVMPYFNIPVRTDFLNILVFMIPYILSIVYLGIFLTMFFRNREDAIMLIMFTSIPAVLITGYSWPIVSLPEWVQYLSYFVPSTLGAKGFVRLSQFGADFSLVRPIWYMMWGLCVFYLILALLAMKKSYLKS